MTETSRSSARPVGVLEGVALVLVGFVIVMVLSGRLDGVALIILLVVGYFGWLARGVIAEAQRVRPVEPAGMWTITLVANLLLMALGIGSFGWYLAGGGTLTWVPFLLFVAGFIALRQWRKGVVKLLYAWRGPALSMLQRGEYHQLVRALEDPATAGQGNPDKMAVVALAYIEMNKWDRADRLLTQAQQLAPDYASVNGALGSLRRHQQRYDEAIEALQAALRFDDSPTQRFYLGLSQYLNGDSTAAHATLEAVIDHSTLTKLGRVYGAYILGRIAAEHGKADAAAQWYARMSGELADVLPLLKDEINRHKRTPYAETLREHVRDMQSKQLSIAMV